MAFIYVLEELATVLLSLFVATQIALPLLFNRPLFPARQWWRRSRELARARDDRDARRAEAAIDHTRKER